MQYTTADRAPSINRAAVSVAVATVCALSGLVWHSRTPVGWERPIVTLLRHDQLPMARRFVLLGQPAPFAIAIAALALAALLSGRPRLALAGPISCVVALGLTEVVLKPLVARHHMQRLSPVFPSGHVTAAAAWAMFAWLVCERFAVLRSVFVFVPVLVGWAVVSFGYHYPADAVVGLLVGGVVVYTIAAGVERLAPVPAGRRQLALTELRHVDLPAAEDRAPAHV